jgi:saccharopine dehydrogenase-like NADP-dependent oxidoreductase
MKNIVLLGSGNVTKAIVEYFYKFKDIFLIIATNDVESGNDYLKQFPQNISIVALDINNEKEASEIIRKGEVVISMLPPFLHKKALEICIREKKNFVCASYLTPELKDLEEEAKKNNVSCFFELGLDPGIDHIVTVHIVDLIRKKNGKIKKLLSLCGGLTAPEFVDNPLAYKFSWSPEGVFKAINEAVYLKDNKNIVVKKEDLMYSAKYFHVNNSLDTHMYPNRDSLKYREIYRIEEVETLIRGTIRFKGFCENVAAFLELGFLDQNELNQNLPDVFSCLDFVKHCLKNENPVFKGDQRMVNLFKIKLANIEEELIFKFLNSVTKNKFWSSLSENERLERMRIILSGFKYLELFSKERKLKKNQTALQTFVDHLKKYLNLKEGDTDFVIMVLDFEVEFPNNMKETIKFKLLKSGDPKNITAMSLLVGLPAAIGAKLLLDGKITKKGVFGPFEPEMCNVLYEEFVKEGVIQKIFRSKSSPDPKL